MMYGDLGMHEFLENTARKYMAWKRIPYHNLMLEFNYVGINLSKELVIGFHTMVPVDQAMKKSFLAFVNGCAWNRYNMYLQIIFSIVVESEEETIACQV